MKITIRSNTVEEEFSYLKYLLKKLKFYEENNYNLSLPDLPEFRKHIDQENEGHLFEVFKNNEYSVNLFDKGLISLNSKKEQIEKCVVELSKLKNFWDFKIFDEYTVCITKYGPGGSYDYNSGKLTMLADIEGLFKRSKPEETVVHEIVHMGVQESIVEKYKLNHWEKEALVDSIVNAYVGHYLENYSMQNIKEINLGSYIKNAKSVEDLPGIVESYIQDFPR